MNKGNNNGQSHKICNYYDYIDANGKLNRIRVGDMGTDGQAVTQEMINTLYGIRKEQALEENRFNYHTKFRFEGLETQADIKRAEECNRLLADEASSLEAVLQRAIDELEDEEMKARAVRALRQLKPEYQFLIINVKIRKRKNKDVARELELSESEISRKLKRAVEALRKKYFEGM